ncbi:hypothetical protein BU14_0051s0029 [Porphyra umbilicalis]|uniref:Uncharacterized protein n=1 Tax=Porphyra umbilicalis TaxID=2786 RepID=A0A1X6PI01_PORUM|nr:hypothetical protein BU14_0051s0029 [Porphyra umbilicalis]|eukprot:OSX80509.1 hypothetical protein BU14_0051s0029 [Porphyra umbilicalis]
MTVSSAYRFHKRVHIMHAVMLVIPVVAVSLAIGLDLQVLLRVILGLASLLAVVITGGILRWAASPQRSPPLERRPMRTRYILYVIFAALFVAANTAGSIASIIHIFRSVAGPSRWKTRDFWVDLVTAIVNVVIIAVTAADIWVARQLVPKEGVVGVGGGVTGV